MSSDANQKNNKLKNIAATASLCVAISLCLLKIFAALMTGSLAVLSSMVDSLSDILASFITLIAVRYSTKPATEKYRYGYGKSEALSSLTQAAFIAGSGLFVLYDGISRIILPREVTDTTLGLFVMILSVIVTIILVSFQRYVAKKTKSQAILADSSHYMVDLLTNSSIIISLLVTRFFQITWFDTLTAIIIALYLLYSATQLAKEAISQLLDKELDENIRNNISKIAQSFDFTKGIHDLRTRDLGGTFFFEIHLELDGNLTLTQAHDYCEQVEEKILKTYPNAQLIIHQDPAGIEEKRLDNQLAKSVKPQKKERKAK